MENIKGIVLPFQKELIERMFEKNKDIVMKYAQKGYKCLETGHKLYVYQSGSNKSIVGEATIKKIEYLTVNECLSKYEDRLIASKNALSGYSAGREDKEALVLELTEIKKYEKEIKLYKPITINGLYLTLERQKEYFVCE